MASYSNKYDYYFFNEKRLHSIYVNEIREVCIHDLGFRGAHRALEGVPIIKPDLHESVVWRC